MSSEFVSVLGIGALAAFLTVLGGVVAERFVVPQRLVSRMLQFAAGVLTALVAFTLMPPALREGNTPNVVGGFFVGGAAFVVMDYVTARREAARRTTEIAAVSTALYLGILVDMLIDGVVIGLGASMTLTAGLLLALSIAISTAPLALVTISLAREQGRPPRFRQMLFALFIAALLGGALLGFLVLRNQSLSLRLTLVAAASGFLITTVTQSIIPEANRDGEPSLAALFFVAGLSLYTLVTLQIG